MNDNKKSQIEAKREELKERLKPYQNATVDAVIEKFETQNRVLVADEVGLGKTEVAKAVIATMAQRHWEKPNGKPFKVAYICPNQNVAKQNFPKLDLFSEKATDKKVEKDYRLSMQHLYTAEAELQGQNQIMQLESLTPSTSLKISNKKGTKTERALLKKTWEICDPSHINFLDITDQVDDISNRCGGCEDEIKKLCREICFAGITDIPGLREAFIKNNIKNLSYDLIIMDEFQNFSELLDAEDNDGLTEAQKLAQALFNKEDTKILLLSATPLQSGCMPKILEEGQTQAHKEEKTDAENRPTSWLETEDSMQSLRDFLDPQKANEEGSLYDLGVVRTSRGLASKNAAMIHEDCIIPVEAEDLLEIYKANLFWHYNYTGWHENYALTTPVASSFLSTYGVKSNCADTFPLIYIDKSWIIPALPSVSEDSTLFLRKNCINKVQHSGFEALKSNLFEHNPQYLLWIPPCNHQGKLGGVFSGMEGFSKTLIFARYNMTPKAFTYLFCEEANPSSDTIPQENLTSLFEELITESLCSFDRTRRAFVEGFWELFQTKEAYLAVLENMKSHNDSISSTWEYSDAVAQYCKDGCFSEMVAEYVALLHNEHGGNDQAMAKTVKAAFGLERDTMDVILQEGKELEYTETTMPNKFAVGLYQNAGTSLSGEVRLGKIKPAFNSPFWPFVFSSTSIGTEGIDFHWYARNVVHWSVPQRPIDFQQREGRVLRYHCHAVRLNNALMQEDTTKTERDYLKMSINPTWHESGLFQTQLNFFSEDEKTASNEGCYHVRSYTYYYAQSTAVKNQRIAQNFIEEYEKCLQNLSPWEKRGENKAQSGGE